MNDKYISNDKHIANDNKTKFWLEDISVLYRNNNYKKLLPKSNMTNIEQLNTLTRFLIYSMFVCLLFNCDNICTFIFAMIIMIIFTYYAFIRKNNDNFSSVITNTMITDKKQTCREPTYDNPFMNPSLEDYNNENVPIACNSDDEDIINDINDKVDPNLFLSSQELFDKTNVMRQFYTIPTNTIPNDQTEFAKLLYNTDNVCKHNQSGCLRYEDIRYKRQLV